MRFVYFEFLNTAHSVLLMARSIYFEDLLFPLLGKRETEYSNSSINDPIEIEIPDSRAIMLEVIHYIYTGVVRYQKLKMLKM